MTRIIGTMLATTGLCVSLHDLVQNGMWLQLAMYGASMALFVAILWINSEAGK